MKRVTLLLGLGRAVCVGASPASWCSPRLSSFSFFFTRCTFRLHRIHVQAGVQMPMYACARVLHREGKKREREREPRKVR